MVEVLDLKDKSLISDSDISETIMNVTGHLLAVRILLNEGNVIGASGAIQMATSAISDLYSKQHGALFSLGGRQNVMIVPQYAEHIEEYLSNIDHIVEALNSFNQTDEPTIN